MPTSTTPRAPARSHRHTAARSWCERLSHKPKVTPPLPQVSVVHVAIQVGVALRKTRTAANRARLPPYHVVGPVHVSVQIEIARHGAENLCHHRLHVGRVHRAVDVQIRQPSQVTKAAIKRCHVRYVRRPVASEVAPFQQQIGVRIKNGLACPARNQLVAQAQTSRGCRPDHRR